MHFDALERCVTWVWIAACAVAVAAAVVLVWPSTPPSVKAAGGIASTTATAIPRERIERGVLALQSTSPVLQLPDLRGQLIFYGTNGRPDSVADDTLRFGFKDGSDTGSVRLGERLYLNPTTGQGGRTGYSWSPDNKSTPLWIEPLRVEGKQVTLRVALEDKDGNRVAVPMERAQIDVTAAEQSKGASWSVGNQKAEPSLLTRQRGRWIGRDLFMEMHGGSAHAQSRGKQRIDFEGGDNYSVYVSEGDMLIWKDNRWRAATAPDTVGFPLLVVRKVEEKSIQFTLWDPTGTSRVDITMNMAAAPGPNKTQLNLRFVGMDTWSRYMVDVDGKRMILHVNDWLLRTNQGWKKIATAYEVDSYVQGKLTGDLLVLDGVEKTSQGTILKGHLFNSHRTTMERVELPLQQKAKVTAPVKPAQPAKEAPSTDEVARRLEQLSEGRGP